MDDNANLFLAQRMRVEGIFPVLRERIFDYIFTSGRLRVLYFVMVAAIYLPAGGSSVAALAMNIVLVAVSFFFAAAAAWNSISYGYGLKDKRFNTSFFFILCF